MTKRRKKEKDKIPRSKHKTVCLVQHNALNTTLSL